MRGAAGLYRTQSNGKVRMSTRPGEHQGLGLAHYLWASSPLRRYSDLVNQRQLLAVLAGAKPPYADNDAELFAALVDFEATYSAYGEFQGRMEHYWCLRWLLQEGVTETTGTVIRENLVRFEGCRSSFACPRCRRLRPTRRCGSRSGASTSSKRRSSRATSEKPTRDVRDARCLERVGADGVARRATVAKASRGCVPPVGARPPCIPAGHRHALG